MKVKINLSALTRMEHSVEVEVPDGAKQFDLQDLVRKHWDEADGSEFSEDMEFWEKGTCTWEVLDGPREGEEGNG